MKLPESNIVTVNPDDNSTWSQELAEFIKLKSANFDFELDVFSNEEDDHLRSIIAPNHILVYHATKLLSYEFGLIKNRGLMPLTPELVKLKIDSAILSGFLTDAQGEDLLNGSSFKTRANEKRANQICLVLGDNDLYKRPYGFTYLINIWGGESINFTDAGNEHRSHLSKIGIPVVIKLGIPVDPDIDLGLIHSLTRPFYGNFLKNPISSEIRWRGDVIPSEWILDMLKPGDPEFDSFKLPIWK